MKHRKKAMRDVVVILPGIGGSVLSKNGKDLWALSSGTMFRTLSSLGRNLGELILTEDLFAEDGEDGIAASRLMSDFHLIPGLWKIDGYTKLLRSITNIFDLRAGENLFEFPYDWRRDNRIAARKLASSATIWLKNWKERSGCREAKLILIAHSMGGLVARYFAECLLGWQNTRILVTFGTPYGGSLNALDVLVNGQRKRLGPITLIDLSHVLRSFTSVYQLLPIYPCLDLGNGHLTGLGETQNIHNLDLRKVRAAQSFHAEIREAAAAHKKDSEYLCTSYQVFPVIGIWQPTLQSARMYDGHLDVIREIAGRSEDGDGTVPRVSSMPNEIPDGATAMFVAERHGSLQNSDLVISHLVKILSGFDSSGYVVSKTKLGLDIEDLYHSQEPVTIRVRTSKPRLRLLAEAVNIDDGRRWSISLSESKDGSQSADFHAFPPGVYRLTVSGSPAIQSVTDIFAVF